MLFGDRLVAPLGLTSARWIILGEVILTSSLRTVADIARHVGGIRQSVQRTIDILYDQEYVEFIDNPRHRRAYLVAPTQLGIDIFEAAAELWRPISDNLAEGVASDDLERTQQVLAHLRDTIERIMSET